MRKVILVTPGKQLNSNLHLRLLYNGLKKHGYKILPMTIANSIKYRCVAIWHIHWIDQFYRGTLQKIGIHKKKCLISFFRVIIFILLLFINKICRQKIIWTVHNIHSHEHGNTISERFVIKLLINCSDRITVFNEHAKKILSKKCKAVKIYIMQQGLYENCYDTTITKEDAREILNLPLMNFVLLHFGALLPYKGVDILIDALRVMEDDSLIVVIAGLPKNIKYGRQIKAMASMDHRVVLIDRFIEEEEIPVLFRIADYTICPYREISNSGVLFMSLTFGVPLIISDKGGVRELIQSEPGTGILLARPDVNNIIKAINEAKNKKYDEKAMSRIQERLSWNALEISILKVFQI